MATKHPKGLYVLFFTEMWERFGFYLLNALLAFYLTERHHFAEGDASNWIGNYQGLVYLSPFFGGLLADRYLGYRRSVLIGAALLAAGYFMLALNSIPALYGAVTLLIMGNGLFKPNISTQVGNLYPQGDPRRDSAFSIFYVGINIGAFLAPFVGEYMRQHYGFPAAFAAAGVGMVLSMLIFWTLGGYLKVADQLSSVAAVLDVPLPAEYEDAPESKDVEKKRIIAIFIVCGIIMFFWVAFQQNATTLNFWAKNNTDRTIHLWNLHTPIPWLNRLFHGQDFEIPPGWFQAVNPLFIFTLTGLVVWLFAQLRKVNREPSTPAKMAMGILLTAAAYAVMVVGSLKGGDYGKVSMWWLNLAYFVITNAELCLSPIGLSLIAKLAPRRMTAMMMGVWFIATAIGNKLAGTLGLLWNVWPHSRFFALLVASSLFAALLLRTQFKRLIAVMPTEPPPQSAPVQAAQVDSDKTAIPVTQPAIA
jgi:POT family proton-dependent oligopeptide transporter